ncbi:MAG: hypothetical protein A3C43_03745 [Candidatus Schekmanbacteria bacterium RIFCSPHIGHO2_02_FULL_38_11]|uniref:Amine oxidase domain-containing protein n=1 Tax=Candidatus Schekmanbacteria bacterium RIFCSPLOWO2_12_FULL_38_15 TaxID=1817883 RepID=A0A1F7SNT9_9BACT|nr:MAG: hypothetical protein A2043_02775 [Candidatus Schekmanbacteria bacterium GWA2_38_9]OGL50256.1 MAG: hypothetical protein A3H37_00695 [Candidatus Schekmanbacteria bacterium RIFCSPLOWO2_02_FULL_38_14]OGL52331.1 MAG: hypothetical protein A3C43_03745 [Candidatus Schekmanbacteria bacterium RIFCSPHIGHO2_02_FULL_38_11]OGL55433.1 MAG: hypothetical protein A3G31_01305 [Candidatus Schekmanbacteria bacterium RIFCSPLOWO2_12_FULL_38_15]
MKVGIIGGGVAGLSSAYELSKKGIKVTLFEKNPVLGGLASSFPLDNGFIERYYHFVCLGDDPLFPLLEELGLKNRLKWIKTKMGLFYDGKLYPFGSPFDLLKFPYLTLVEKLKFGFALMEIKSRNADDWKDIENIPSPEWLISKFGKNVYEILHEPLIRLKFGAYASNLSAAWMWARIHRIGKSRSRITQKETLGYLEGGTKTLIDKLEKEIINKGGEIIKGTAATGIELSSALSLKGIKIDSQITEFDAVISTAPSPVFLNLLPSLAGTYWGNLKKIDSIGVVCVLMKTEKPLTETFWLNINDRRISLAGVIEYTNLNPCTFLNGGKIIYLPQYLPSTDERFSWDDKKIISQYTEYLHTIRSDFKEKDIKSAYVFRDKYAQPICEVGFSKVMPDIKTPVKGLYMTDSSQLHPDDRTISNSIDLGRKATKLIFDDFK